MKIHYMNGGTKNNEYTYEQGEFLFHMSGEVISRNKEIMILFNRPTGTIYSHGNPDIVKMKHDEAYKKYINNGFEDEAMELITITISDFRHLEELNKCINIAGYLHKYQSQLSNV